MDLKLICICFWQSESRSVVYESLRPHGLYRPWNSPGQNTGIFPTQGLNPGLPHCRQILHQLIHKGSACFWKSAGTLFVFTWVQSFTGFPDGSAGKNPPANAGEAGLIPGLGRSPGGGNGNPLQYSCLGNPMDRGAWLATVHGVLKSWAGATKQQHRVLQFTKHPNVPINQGTRADYALIFFNNDLLWFISLRYWKDALCLYLCWLTNNPSRSKLGWLSKFPVALCL